MDSSRIGIKLFLANPKVHLEDVVTVFHSWIQQQALAGTLLIDVADYLHVPTGPGIVLVAHEANSHIVYSELLKALDHPVVRPVIERVSSRRLEYLTASFRQAGLGRGDAQHRARLAYAAYIGFLQLNLQLQHPRLQHDEFEAYVGHMMATLIPG